MMNPLVSIIVPFSAATSGFVKCLDSLINQTLQEIEILLIPEQADEEVTAVVKEYQQRDSRILIFPEEEGCLSRNTGLKNATGEFVTFLDPDGWVQEETYEKLYEIASQEQTDILMGNGSFCYRSGRKSEIYKSSAPSVSEDVFSGKEAFIFLSRYGEVNLTPAISLYKRKFIEKNHHTFQSHLHENELWGPITLCTAERVKIIGYSFYSWYQSPMSKSAANRFEERYHALMSLADKLEKFIDRYSFENGEKTVKSWLYVRLVYIYYYAIDQFACAELTDLSLYKEKIIPLATGLKKLEPAPAEAAGIYYKLIKDKVKNNYDLTLPEKE